MTNVKMGQNERYTFAAAEGDPVLLHATDHALANGATMFRGKVEIDGTGNPGATNANEFQLLIRQNSAETRYGPNLRLKQDGTGDAGINFYAGSKNWSIGVDNVL